MATLTPAQLVNLAQQTINARVKSRDLTGTSGTVVLVDAADPSKTSSVELRDIDQRVIMAASIMMAESGGKTDARCYNYDGPNGPTCSPTPLPAGTKGTERGIDRGLWQWNSKAWPDISDMAADEPETATDIAYRVSKGFTTWGPWRGSKGLDPNSAPSKAVQAAFKDMMGDVRDDTPILSWIDPDANGTPDGLAPALGWLEALGKLLSNLLSPAWWRRLGIGALGLLLVIIAVVLVVAGAQ